MGGLFIFWEFVEFSLLWSFLTLGGVLSVACQGFLVRVACVGVLVGGAGFLLSKILFYIYIFFCFLSEPFEYKLLM